MALGNVLVPAWIKTHEQGQVLLQTIYGTGLMIGGGIGAALAARWPESLGGWRPSLGLWGWLALSAVPAGVSRCAPNNCRPITVVRWSHRAVAWHTRRPRWR